MNAWHCTGCGCENPDVALYCACGKARWERTIKILLSNLLGLAIMAVYVLALAYLAFSGQVHFVINH